MKSNYKAREHKKRMVDLSVNNLKIFLLALMRSEGFGERRLIRVLYEFCELANESKYDNDEMLMIDSIIEKVIGKQMMENIGYEEMELKI